MKVGDKVYCIKSIIKYNFFFIIGNSYKIKNVSNNNKTIFILDDNNVTMPFEIYYPNDDFYKFNEYFITHKQLRKQKLEKINECR